MYGDRVTMDAHNGSIWYRRTATRLRCDLRDGPAAPVLAVEFGMMEVFPSNGPAGVAALAWAW
jgi:hypothetical protein